MVATYVMPPRSSDLKRPDVLAGRHHGAAVQ